MVLTGLLVGAALGFVLQRGRFCVTSAYRDVWLSRQTRMVVAALLVIAVQAVGLLVLTQTGVISPETKPLALGAVVVGALVFGFSMILAGGCATGTYYRAGEGLVGSWFALVTYAGTSAVMKNGALADQTKAARGATVDATTINDTFGVPAWVGVSVLVAGVGWAVARHLRKPKVTLATLPPRRTGLAHLLLEKRWHPFATATLIGLIGIIAWPLSAATGRNDGLGITTPSSKLVGFLVTGDTGLVDWGVYLVLGVLAGSYLAAKASGEFRVRVPSSDVVVKSIVGGVGMGVGACLAGGCTVGNGMVQTALLTWQGWIAFVVMLLGAGIATQLFIVRPRRAAQSQGASTATASAPAGQPVGV